MNNRQTNSGNNNVQSNFSLVGLGWELRLSLFNTKNQFADQCVSHGPQQLQQCRHRQAKVGQCEPASPSEMTENGAIFWNFLFNQFNNNMYMKLVRIGVLSHSFSLWSLVSALHANQLISDRFCSLPERKWEKVYVMEQQEVRRIISTWLTKMQWSNNCDGWCS